MFLVSRIKVKSKAMPIATQYFSKASQRKISEFCFPYCMHCTCLFSRLFLLKIDKGFIHTRRPAELQAYRTNQADISRLLTICTTTNKYHFNTTEAWASSALYDVLSEEYGSIKDEYDLSYCSSSTMTKILEVAILCGHSDLKDLVQRLWVGRLWTNELNPLKAIRFANSHYDLDKLRGVASYVLLRRLDKKLRYDPDNDDNAESDDDATQDKDANATPERGPKLSDQERNSLLMGHISLTHLWDRVRSSPPRFERPDGCTYHQHGCLTTWTHIWDEVARSPTTLNNVKYQTMDVVGKLMSMKEQLFGNADLQCALTPGCRRRALESVRVLIKEVTDGLAEHFVTVS